jgi:nitroreductase
MQLFDAIRSRRTTNGAFQAQPIVPEHLRQLLELASHAPSHFNSQPWRFIVVQDQARRQQIANIAGDSMRILMEQGTFWRRYSRYFRFSQAEVEQSADGIYRQYAGRDQAVCALCVLAQGRRGDE